MALRLTAYCDESGTQGNDLVLAGYVAAAVEWDGVDRAWRQELDAKGLTEFKTVDCFAGQGEFKGRTDRVEIRDRFFALLDQSDLDAFAVRVDLKTFPAVRAKLASNIRPGFNKAYLHGMSALLQFMTEFANDKPEGERIDFVFDEQDEFRGRALEMYEAIKKMPGIPVRAERLGTIAFADSKLVAALQAADALAYRVHHDHRNAPQIRRSSVHSRARCRVALLGAETIVDDPRTE